MEGSEIPKVASEHLGPQPLPEISHCDCAGVNCTQKSRQRGAHKMGTLRAQNYEEFRQFVGPPPCAGVLFLGERDAA